jgi:excinuclease ABC subunit C
MTPHFLVPKRGDKKDLVSFSLGNAREEVERTTTREERTRKLLVLVAQRLGLSQVPLRIESVDISNTLNSERVGAMVCYMDGRPLKKAYKRFIIHDETIQDDYHSMENVLSRRWKRALAEDAAFEELPDLLLVDGGYAHAAMARRVLDSFGQSTPVFGMVKDDRHRTRALVNPQGAEIGITDIPALFAFFGQIQEETHRFAIEFHRERRSKFSTDLDGIPGLGKKRKALLLNTFQSVPGIRKASLEQLQEVVPKTVAELVFAKFHTNIPAGKDGTK